MDAKGHSDLLKKAMQVAPDPLLPKKTQEEQAAGRDRLLGHLRASVVDVGVAELQARFSKRSVPGPGGLQFKDDKWVASIYVWTAAKTYMGFEEDLINFPSEHMVAQIALVT